MSDVVTTCFHHTNRETGRACTRCGRPACSDCLHPAAVGSHCFECIRAARPPRKEQLRRWNATQGPLVTKIIIGINVVVYLLTTAGSIGANHANDLETRLVLFWPAVEHGDWYRLITSGFVHFGLIHIGFNMVLLYRFGDMLEPALGRFKFVVLFTASLLAGSAGALILTPNAFTGGASGAVFGLMGAAAVGMRQRGISLSEGGLGGLIVINLILSVAIPGISLGGHVGGLIGGGVVGGLLLRHGRAGRSRLG